MGALPQIRIEKRTDHARKSLTTPCDWYHQSHPVEISEHLAVELRSKPKRRFRCHSCSSDDTRRPYPANPKGQPSKAKSRHGSAVRTDCGSMYVALQSSMHDDIRYSTSGSGTTSLHSLERWTSPGFPRVLLPMGLLWNTCDVADGVRGNSARASPSS